MIDSKTYCLPENNYYSEKYKKNQIVIGHNGRKDMRHVQGWLRRNGGEYKKTSHFSIDKDGKIYQHFNPDYYSDFIGVEQDKSNISITLVNQGWLKLDQLNNVYTDWLGHTYGRSNENIINKSWRDYEFWVKYTDEQYESLLKLTSKLCEDFEIPKECIGNNVYDEDVDIYNGVVFRSNYSQDIRDVSPAFNMDIFKNL